MRLLKQVLSFALDFFLIYAKTTLTFIHFYLFSIANDCSVNLSDLSKMLVKKQMKYFDVPLDHEELLNTRTNNVYVDGFDDYVITDMINLLCNE